MYIDEIIQWLNSTISNYPETTDAPENNEAENAKNPEDTSSQIEFLSDFIEVFEFTDQIIDKFYFSALSGEYISDSEYDTKLENINQLIGDCGRISPENSELINGIKQVRSLVKQYRHFILRIRSKYLKPDRIELFNSITDLDDSYYENSKNEIEIKCGLFKHIVLGISEIDHNLSLKADHDTFSNLLFSLSKVSETQQIAGAIKILIEAKCNVLLYKLAKRVEQDEKKYYYTDGLSDKEFEINDTVTLNSKGFIDDVDLQYFDDIGKSDLKNKFLDFCKKVKNFDEGSTLSLKEAHALVKYFKDKNTTNDNNLELLCAKFSVEVKSAEHVFDKRAKRVSYHYLLNNYFSFLVSKDLDSNAEILRELNKIKDKQLNDDVENYFPYLRYGEYLIKQVEANFGKANVDKISTKEYLNAFDLNFKTLMNKYEWCYDRDFLAFMPMFDECVKTEQIEGNEFKLFIASSFVLPINYAQVKREIDELYQKYTKFRLMLEAITILDDKIGKKEKEFADIEERVKDSERKNIEILGIFAAIVLFTMSNIQIFSKIDYVKDAILFMLIMAYCMSLFIVVIWLITRDKGYFGKDDDYKAIINKTPALHKVIIGLLIIATATSLIYTVPYFSSVKSDSREKKFEYLQTQIDSLIDHDTKADLKMLDFQKKDTVVKPELILKEKKKLH